MRYVVLFVFILFSISAFSGKREREEEFSSSSSSMDMLDLESDDSSEPELKRTKFDPNAFVSELDLNDEYTCMLLQRAKQKLDRKKEISTQLTPVKRKRTPVSIHSSEDSKRLKDAIYYISDDVADLYPEKIDLNYEFVTQKWLVDRLKRVVPNPKIRVPFMNVNQFFWELSDREIPYYIGRTIQKIQKRKAGHVSSGDSDSYTRKSVYFQEHGKLPMRVLIYNIHPDQIAVIEDYLIDRYRANLGINLNSSTGTKKLQGPGVRYFRSERYVSPASTR